MEYPHFKVCVRCFTFNQSKYITDALNGFVMQQTDFPFVCCIVDDASSDGEQEVIRRYVEDNFDLTEGSCYFERETDYAFITYAQHKTNNNCYFAVLYLKENHYSIRKKKMPYLAEWRDMCEYEAICEGDDYWIATNKLQLQIDALEKDPQSVLCHTSFCHRYGKRLIDSKDCINNKKYTFSDPRSLIYGDYIIQTMTVVCRRCIVEAAENMDKSLFDGRFLMGDTQMWFQYSKLGNFIFIPNITSVYRHVSGSNSRKSGRSRYRFALSGAEMRKYLSETNLFSEKLQDEINIKYRKAFVDYMAFDITFRPMFPVTQPLTCFEKLVCKSGLRKLYLLVRDSARHHAGKVLHFISKRY